MCNVIAISAGGVFPVVNIMAARARAGSGIAVVAVLVGDAVMASICPVVMKYATVDVLVMATGGCVGSSDGDIGSSAWCW